MRLVTILLGLLIMAEDIYGFSIRLADGSEKSLSEFKGKVIIIVNTATKCGYANQLSELQILHEEFAPKGLVVLAIPTNDFGRQEPLSGQELLSYCSNNHGAKYLISDRLSIKDPIFDYLTSHSNSVPKRVLWNFEKFIVDKNGKVRFRFRSRTSPTDPSIKEAITKLLQE